MATQNIFNNVSMITAKALRTVRNNLKMASRVSRRWDGDFHQSFRIGDTLNIRRPGFYTYRSGAAAQPGGYNDTYQPVQMLQGGMDIELTVKELTLNVDEFQRNIVEPLAATLWQQIDASIIANIVPTAASPIGIAQFSGTIGTAPTNLTPFVDGYANMQDQSAVFTDDRISGMLNPHMQASLFTGLSTLFNPSSVIAEQYRNGSIGNAGGIDFYSTANTPSLTLGTWSGTIVYSSGASDGGNTITVGGMTGTFAPGECFTINGVQSVNPSGKGLQAELKHFTVVSQAGAVITFSPNFYLTGPLQNINALPTGSASINPWGYTTATALSAGTGQVVKQSLVFHEEAFALCMGDLIDVGGMGGVGGTRISSRMMDPQSGLRCSALFWLDGYNHKVLFRLDTLYGSTVMRQGFANKVVQ